MTRAIFTVVCLMTILMPKAFAQSRAVTDITVCIEHVGTRGFVEASLFSASLIVANSKAALNECHKVLISWPGEDLMTLPFVVSSTKVRTLVSELNGSPSLLSAENQLMGTYRFVVITPTGQKTRILDKTQTVIFLRSLMRQYGKGHAYRVLREYVDWLDEYKPCQDRLAPCPNGPEEPQKP
jgi:hypothetical protein